LTEIYTLYELDKHTGMSRVENSHQDRPQHTEHATRTVRTLNQWLCEQLCELSWRCTWGPETCRDRSIYE